jgi:hypothetical protein
MGLEIPTNKVPGAEMRRTPAPRPAIVGALILAFIVLEFVFIYLTFNAVSQGWNSPHTVTEAVANAPLAGIFKSDQQIISSWLAGVFFCLSFIILLYQRYFLDHVTIAKRRFRKWEDEGVNLK